MKKILFLVTVAIIMSGCGDAGDPALVVQDYLQAKIRSDLDGIKTLLCSEMEDSLNIEAGSFQGIAEVELKGMTCERVDDSEVVSCEGKIVALYGTEELEFELASYRVVLEDGQWRWCGEAALP